MGTAEDFLIGVEKKIAPGATELVGTPCEVTSRIVGQRSDPYFASIWLPMIQGSMNVVTVRIGRFKLAKLGGTRAISEGGEWVILRLADPVRVPAGDEVLLEVRNTVEPAEVKTRVDDPLVFRAMLGFVLKPGEDKPAGGGVIIA